jgi:hypothetical protein
MIRAPPLAAATPMSETSMPAASAVSRIGRAPLRNPRSEHPMKFL